MADLMLLETTLPGEWSDTEVLSWIRSAAGLASCVHRSKIQSTYAWGGEVCDETEWLMRMKVSQSRLDRLTISISEHHPYDVPMILTYPCSSSEAYTEWVGTSTIHE